MLAIIAASRRRAFDPLSLSPALWLSDTGSDAGTWPDISGFGRDAIQATAGRQPAIISSGMNGRQVRRFDGGDFLSNAAAVFGLSSISGFFVIKETTKVQNAGIFSALPASGNDYESSTAILLQSGNTALSRSIYITGNTNALAGLSPSATFPKGLYAFIKTATSVTFWTNGSSSETDSSFTAFATNSGGGYALGCRYLSGAINTTLYLFNGDIAEILIYPSALSTTNRQAVETYLNAKWAIY